MARFAWFEYMTSEPAKAQAFFKAAFGWEAQTYALQTGAQYTVIVCGGRAIGGYGAPVPGTPIFRYSEPYSRWLPYLQAADGHATVGMTKARGGSVAREMTPIHDGRLAVLVDPAGQHFGVWQPATHAPREWGAEPGSLCWCELYSQQPLAAAVFFKHVAGFTEQKSQLPDGPYHTLYDDGVPHAGIRKPMAGSQLGWFPWVRVPNLAATITRALEYETVVIQAPGVADPIQKALLVDPYGATIGLVMG